MLQLKRTFTHRHAHSEQNLVEINKAIVEKIRRKIYPFYTRTQKKIFQSQLNSPDNKQDVNLFRVMHIRSSEGAAQVVKVSQRQPRIKMKSQAIIIEKQNNYKINKNYRFISHDQHEHEIEQFVKYDKLKSKVTKYIQEQRLKIFDKSQVKKSKKKKILKMSHQLNENSSEDRQYYCGIVTSRIRPFDFRKALQDIKMKKNQCEKHSHHQNFQKSKDGVMDDKISMKEKDLNQMQCKIHLKNSNIIKQQNLKLETTLKKKKKRKQSIFNPCVKDQDNTENKEQQVTKQKKKARFKQIKRKNSILFNNQQNQYPDEDEIDLQFKQGLVQQIYTSQRIKFRQKINKVRSRKNLAESTLYFLKQ